MAGTPKCRFKGCGREERTKGLCDGHYQQLLRSAGNEALLRPLREGPARIGLTVRLNEDARNFLGDKPAERAREILEGLAEKQRRKAS